VLLWIRATFGFQCARTQLEEAVKDVCVGLVGESAQDIPDFQVVFRSVLDITRIRDVTVRSPDILCDVR
jgi:hypothetical protein